MGKIANTWEIMKASWGVLKKDKEIVMFPVFSSIASVIQVLRDTLPGRARRALSMAANMFDGRRKLIRSSSRITAVLSAFFMHESWRLFGAMSSLFFFCS